MHTHSHRKIHINTHYCLGLLQCCCLPVQRSPQHPIFTADIQNNRNCFRAALRKASIDIPMHLYLFLTPSDTKECHFQNNFIAVMCHAITTASKAGKTTVLALIVPFCGRRREGEVLLKVFPTTLSWCNLRIPADLHNSSLVLMVMETLSGMLRTGSEKHWWSVMEHQTKQ